MKYTFPVVRAVLEKVGPPREIKNVPPPQAGPLLVTLAMDISSDCCRDICLRLEAASVGGSVSADCLIPDLYEGVAVRSDGAGQLLLRSNARWWTQFAATAEARFRSLALGTGPLRMYLRSAMVKFAAEETAGNRINYDAALLQVIKNPQERFSLRFPKVVGLKSLNEAAIRKERSILMKEDAQQKHWIQARSGCCHPCTSSYWDEKPLRLPEYVGRRALNELYYCLAQETSGWTPTFSESFSRVDWENWLDKASGGSPPYWHPI